MITAKTKKPAEPTPKEAKALASSTANMSASESDSSVKMLNLDPETRHMLQTVVRIKKGKDIF
jgi:hypothetical protein